MRWHCWIKPVLFNERAGILIMSGLRASLAFGLAGALVATIVFAQGSYKQHKEQIELTRWSIQSERKAAVANNLQLSEQGSKSFWPLYDDYRSYNFV